MVSIRALISGLYEFKYFSNVQRTFARAKALPNYYGLGFRVQADLGTQTFQRFCAS